MVRANRPDNQWSAFLNKRKMLLKTLLIWILIAVGEVLNGNIRVKYLQRKFGRNRGKQLSLLSGISIFYLISWCFLPWIGPNSIIDCFFIGLVWVCLMTLFDIYFGRYVFRLPWNKVLDDFNPLKGNLLAIGMLLLFFCPSIIFLLK